eukprot:Rhum_TRINITY_DN11898_c0_g1::Rhum_TRINITY_DN11898_c0_g1_i1::g.47679::m.47679
MPMMLLRATAAAPSPSAPCSSRQAVRPTGLNRLTRSDVSHDSGGMLRSVLSSVTPAQCTTPSTRPSQASAIFAAAAAQKPSLRSARSSSRNDAGASAGGRTSTCSTCSAPRRSHRSATSRPMPPDAPVTTTRLSMSDGSAYAVAEGPATAMLCPVTKVKRRSCMNQPTEGKRVAQVSASTPAGTHRALTVPPLRPTSLLRLFARPSMAADATRPSGLPSPKESATYTRRRMPSLAASFDSLKTWDTSARPRSPRASMTNFPAEIRCSILNLRRCCPSWNRLWWSPPPLSLLVGEVKREAAKPVV